MRIVPTQIVATDVVEALRDVRFPVVEESGTVPHSTGPLSYRYFRLADEPAATALVQQRIGARSVEFLFEDTQQTPGFRTFDMLTVVLSADGLVTNAYSG